MLGRLTESHDEAKYASVPLLGESMVVVVRTAHPVFERATVTLAGMANWSWVLQPPGLAAARALRGGDARGRHPGPARHHRNGIAHRHYALLENSDMAAVMPASQANHYARLGVLRTVPVELPVRVPPICLITPEKTGRCRRRPHSSAVSCWAAP